MIAFDLNIKTVTLPENKGLFKFAFCFFFYLLALQLMPLNNVLAQNVFERQLNYADSLFARKDYFNAITEYKRLKYFDSTGKYHFISDFNIALSYKRGAKFNDAINYFDIALSEARSDQEEFKANIEIIKTLILTRKIKEALRKLTSLKKVYFGKKFKELEYWQGWAFMFGERWEQADSLFTEMGQKELSRICKNVLNERYSLTVAKIFSYLVPGAGQLYAGHPFSGLMSFAWNALWGYLTLKAFFAQRFFDGIVIGNLLWFRFYRGNLQNAQKFVLQENEKIYNDAYDFLQFKFKGKKL